MCDYSTVICSMYGTMFYVFSKFSLIENSWYDDCLRSELFSPFWQLLSLGIFHWWKNCLRRMLAKNTVIRHGQANNILPWPFHTFVRVFAVSECPLQSFFGLCRILESINRPRAISKPSISWYTFYMKFPNSADYRRVSTRLYVSDRLIFLVSDENFHSVLTAIISCVHIFIF